MRTKTLAVDFDGVLNAYTGEWDGYQPTTPPVEGAQWFCREVMERGIDIVVFSCRALSTEGQKGIEEWLTKHNFPAMVVTGTKPVATWYLDDRGWRFNGDFASFLDLMVVLERPWWKPDPGQLVLGL